MLLFYNCDEGESIREDSIPRHMLGEWENLSVNENIGNKKIMNLSLLKSTIERLLIDSDGPDHLKIYPDMKVPNECNLCLFTT